ncbi:hypothetical protein Tsubulata_044357 [Turnera subulata]|uniref:F-box domain-containing protein n=1 Tax=Turnera subulata TaxID=218843 RepID=A0A9Q0F8R2_9ROSI|nr:hypothetical protein Tsubulata_044357 [Turnera subulata]
MLMKHNKARAPNNRLLVGQAKSGNKISTNMAAPNRSNLPPDVVEAILDLLPIKSIERFRSVSKSLFSLLAAPKLLYHPCKSLFELNVPEPASGEFGICTVAELLQNLGIVLAKKSKGGKRFGFIRINQCSDIEKIVDGINSISVDEETLNASVARARVPNKVEGKNSIIAPVGNPNLVSKGVNFRDRITGNNGKRVVNDAEICEGASNISIKTHEQTSSWLSRCAFGSLNAPSDIGEVIKTFHSHNIHNVKVSDCGGDAVLVQFHSKADRDEFLAQEYSWINNEFQFLGAWQILTTVKEHIQWTVNVEIDGVQTCVNVTEVPESLVRGFEQQSQPCLMKYVVEDLISLEQMPLNGATKSGAHSPAKVPTTPGIPTEDTDPFQLMGVIQNLGPRATSTRQECNSASNNVKGTEAVGGNLSKEDKTPSGDKQLLMNRREEYGRCYSLEFGESSKSTENVGTEINLVPHEVSDSRTIGPIPQDEAHESCYQYSNQNIGPFMETDALSPIQSIAVNNRLEGQWEVQSSVAQHHNIEAKSTVQVGNLLG